MEFTAEQIAGFIDGIVDGNPQEKVNNVSKIEEGIPEPFLFLPIPNMKNIFMIQKLRLLLLVTVLKLKRKQLQH